MAVTAKEAVAGLAAAANNIEGLTLAIEKASFLDATPGDDRQKLRAARTKLRDLKKKEAAKKAAASSNSAKSVAERSPHVKESYNVADFPALVEKYEKLNWRIISKPGGATVKPDDFYELYGFHQQAANGNNNTERPMWAEKGGLDFEGRARWDAWKAVEGMPSQSAKLEFVRAYYEFSPKSLYSDTRGTS